MIDQVTIRTADTADTSAVVELVHEASAWLGSKGVDQWQRPVSVDRLTRDIDHGDVFIAHDQAGNSIATISLSGHADPDFWTAADNPGSAIYVHRLVVTRRLAGQGLGAALLDWAAERAHRKGYQWLRLDAWRTNEELLNYYSRLGWTHLRTVTAPGRSSGALYQRATSPESTKLPFNIVDHTDRLPEDRCAR